MDKVKRLDFLTTPFPKSFKTDQGFLRIPIRATRTGVFKYILPNGELRRELRLPEEVFNPESMATLSNVPITDTHPKNMVTSKNATGLTVGFTGDKVIKDEDTYLLTQGSIIDERKISRIESLGNQEVSCGYTADLEMVAGLWENEAYDAIQRNIRYNHLALVDKGRAGSNVRLILDSDEAVLYNDNITVGDSMKVKIGDKEFEMSDEAGKAFQAFTKKKDAEFALLKGGKETAEKEKTDAETSLETVKSDLDKSNAKADTLDVEIKSLKEEVKSGKEKMDNLDIDSMVIEKKNLVETASKFLGDEKLDGLSNIDIKKKVVGKVLADVKVDEKSEDYINTSFETISKMEVKVDSLADAFKIKEDGENDDKKEIYAQDALEASTETAYKTKFD